MTEKPSIICHGNECEQLRAEVERLRQLLREQSERVYTQGDLPRKGW